MLRDIFDRNRKRKLIYEAERTQVLPEILIISPLLNLRLYYLQFTGESLDENQIRKYHCEIAIRQIQNK